MLVVVIVLIVFPDLFKRESRLVVIHKFFDLVPVTVTPVFKCGREDHFVHQIPGRRCGT